MAVPFPVLSALRVTPSQFSSAVLCAGVWLGGSGPCPRSQGEQAGEPGLPQGVRLPACALNRYCYGHSSNDSCINHLESGCGAGN